MELFIRIQDGQSFEHPMVKDNLLEAFPEIDIQNLPPWLKRFERVEEPSLSPYEVFEGTHYEEVNGVIKDVHTVRVMTESERLAKQNAVKNSWAQNGYASWLFDEATCNFLPPVAYPNDGKAYQWDEATTNWIGVTND